MNNSHDALLSILDLLLSSGIPLLLVIFSASLLWRNILRNAMDAQSIALLVCGVVLSALLWICLYGKHYTDGTIRVFDVGAPIFSVVALMVLPILGLIYLSSRLLKGHPPLYGLEIISTYALFLVSLIPGIYLVVFYSSWR